MSNTVSKPTGRQRRLLQRLLNGDTPRASHAEYKDLCDLSGLGNVLQLESRWGADTRGGYVLTALRTIEETDEAVRSFLVSHK